LEALPAPVAPIVIMEMESLVASPFAIPVAKMEEYAAVLTIAFAPTDFQEVFAMK